LRGQDIRTIALPFFNNLKEEQIDYVVEKLKEGIENSIEYRVSSEEKKKKKYKFQVAGFGFQVKKNTGNKFREIKGDR